MIASTLQKPRLIERVRRVDHQVSRTNVAVMVSVAVLIWLLAVAAIAAIDFVFEVGWTIRAVLLGGATVVVLTGLVGGLVHLWRRRSLNRTAAGIERQFPEFGQRARTVVQFGGRSEADMQAEGVRPELVEALVTEASQISASVPMEEAVPREQLRWCIGSLVVVVLMLAAGCFDWEWRRAMSRALLSGAPYTELAVVPGDVTVQSGAAVTVTATLTGRTDRDVVLHVRNVDRSGSWSLQQMLAETAGDEEIQLASFGGGVDGIDGPLVYRVEADSLISPEYHINVLDPLVIRDVTTDVEYPPYTGVPIRTTSEGDVSALRGSQCRVAIELSRPPTEVTVELQRLPKKNHSVEQMPGVELKGSIVSFEMTAEQDLLWTLRATTADGVSLKPRPVRLRVTADRPPRLSFDSPRDNIEVHTLAELPMRARATDDYGLTRCGVVFQISGSEEYTLLEEHFQTFLDAIENANTGDAAPSTRAVLERLLPLEHFELTSRDAVMYYAFAEDNYPQEPQRSETERQFIDIRPLLQTFRKLEPGDGGGGGGMGLPSRLTSLNELINRERSILNWTIKMSRTSLHQSDRTAYSYDRLMKSQADVADLTRLLAEGLQERGIDDVDALYQAEAAMLEAIDSLSAGDLETAVFQEKDAQQYLVEARDQVELAITRGALNGRSLTGIRNLNDLIMQKIRRETDEGENDEEVGQLIIAQLMRWAREEEQIARQLSQELMSTDGGGASVVSDTETDDQPTGAGATATGEEPGQETAEDQAVSASDDDSDDASSETPGADTEASTEDSENSTSAPDSAEDADIEAERLVNLDAVEEHQYTLLADARELASAMADVESVTALANERMAAITETMDDAASSIEEGELQNAEEAALVAARQLRELARQLNGLTQGDVLDRIAYGRNLSVDLSRRSRRLADDLPASADGDDTSDTFGLGMSAQDVAERAQTLEDVLLAVATSTMPDAAEAADRVAVAIEEQDLAGIKGQLSEVPGDVEMIEDTREPELVARAAANLRHSADASERLAVVLDVIYRELMKPVMEQLREFENQAAGLSEELAEVDNEAEGGAALEELEELLERMQEAGAGGDARNALDELLRNNRGAAWVAASGRLRLKAEFKSALAELLRELQREMQELVLSDTDFDADAPIPSMYESLIERYLKVLSQGD